MNKDTGKIEKRTRKVEVSIRFSFSGRSEHNIRIPFNNGSDSISD